MEWFLKLVRIGGASFPVTASFVQLQAEIDSEAIKNRLLRLEDPISCLHEDIPSISKGIYQELVKNDSVNLDFDTDFYEKYSRVIATLTSHGLISVNGVLGNKYPRGINLIEPSYIMYMCALSAAPNKSAELFDIVDRCEVGQTLDATQLSDPLGLPKYVIRVIFEIYANKGLGYQSGGLTKFRYTGKA